MDAKCRIHRQPCAAIAGEGGLIQAGQMRGKTGKMLLLISEALRASLTDNGELPCALF